MAPETGFEPATSKLTASCSTTELLRNIKERYLLNKFSSTEVDYTSKADNRQSIEYYILSTRIDFFALNSSSVSMPSL